MSKTAGLKPLFKGEYFLKSLCKQSTGDNDTLYENWFTNSLWSVIEGKKKNVFEEISLLRISSIYLKCDLKDVPIKTFGIGCLEEE